MIPVRWRIGWGVKAECDSNGDLACHGVPWAQTPYVGAHGQCTASGTTWGQYGPDASRTPWRIAMDYILYSEESTDVTMYDSRGHKEDNVTFNAKVYLNRFVRQYLNHAECDGGVLGECPAYKLANAFSESAPGMTCRNVPNTPQGWWCPFMSYPTFTAFVAPASGLTLKESATWMDTFASLCDFSAGTPTGSICSTSYFELSQEVVATMITSGALIPLNASASGGKAHHFIGADHAYVPASAAGGPGPGQDFHHDGFGWRHPRPSQVRTQDSGKSFNSSMLPGPLVQVLQTSTKSTSLAPADLVTLQRPAHGASKPQAAKVANASRPSAYQECTTICEDGCTCVDHGGGYHQCEPPQGSWRCDQAVMIIRRFSETGHVRGPRQANKHLASEIFLGVIVLGMVALGVVSIVSRSAQPAITVTECSESRRGSFQPLMDGEDDIEFFQREATEASLADGGHV